MIPTAGRRKLTVILALVVLALVAVQVVLLVPGWSGSSRDWFNLVMIVCQFALAMTALWGGVRTQKRGGSEAAPPVDNSP